MATERRGAALLDGGHDLELGQAQVAALRGAPGRPVGAEDVADLEGRVTSQLPVKAWHTYLNDPTLADAILDRIVHSSHRIDLKGKSLREGEADEQ